jgi:DNA-binding protein HU-beta
MAGKPDLVNKVAAESGLNKTQSAKAIDALVKAIQTTLTAGESVALSGFGTFRVVPTAARKGRNPATGKPMQIPASQRVSFSVGTRLNAAVKGSAGQKKAATKK